MLQHGIESYIAVPLFRMNGEYFGTLCAMDPEPKNLSEVVFDTFELLGNLIAFELEADEQAREKEKILKLTKKSDESKARFMSILGHDLRSPLHTIMMAANIQKMGSLSAQKSKDISEMILKTAKRMQFLIEDLLDTTQGLQGSKIRIVKKNLDIIAICKQIIDEFEIANPKLHITFHSQGKSVGDWDEGRIGQVLTNLLSNAIYHGDIAKPIKVDLIEDGQDVVLQVNNQGKGIGEDTKQNLFTPFWRGVRKNANSSGLGLGLYIVKQIVDSHGGTIKVDSTPEYGTTFTVRFHNEKLNDRSLASGA